MPPLKEFKYSDKSGLIVITITAYSELDANRKLVDTLDVEYVNQFSLVR